MSIATQIERLQNAKESIKQKLIEKGVEVSDDVKLDQYGELIDTIPSGGGSKHNITLNFYLYASGNVYYYLDNGSKQTVTTSSSITIEGNVVVIYGDSNASFIDVSLGNSYENSFLNNCIVEDKNVYVIYASEDISVDIYRFDYGGAGD